MPEYTDDQLNKMVFRAIVPRGLRPETPEEIDSMLDAIGAEPLPEDVVQRMLRKVRGEEPLRGPGAESPATGSETEPAELPDAELALFRNREGEIPPDVEQMLRDMENEALEDGEEREDESDGQDV